MSAYNSSGYTSFTRNKNLLQAKKGKREPWREVYAGSDKLAAPAPGNTNAFSYSNDGHIMWSSSLVKDNDYVVLIEVKVIASICPKYNFWLLMTQWAVIVSKLLLLYLIIICMIWKSMVLRLSYCCQPWWQYYTAWSFYWLDAFTTVTLPHSSG